MWLAAVIIALLLAVGSLYSIAKNPQKRRMHRIKNRTTRL